MNESAYYLGQVLEYLIRDVLEEQRELKKKRTFSFLRKKKEADNLGEGILAGHYIVIGKLFNAVASLGVFEALPKNLQEHITPSTLVEDLKKWHLKRMLRLRQVFRDTHDKISYGDMDLKSLLEEIISEGLLLRSNLQSEFDEGKLLGYSFCLLTLYNQVEFFVPKLFKALPKKLRKFVPESLSSATFKKHEDVPRCVL